MNKSTTNRKWGIDFMRCLAIVLVLVEHGRHLLQPILLFDSKLLRLGGFWGVELFFVLSGFLIGNILIRQLINPPALLFPKLKVFWKRRWYRTLPNYYLILLINLIIAFLFSSKQLALSNYIPFFFFCQNLTEAQVPFYNESWTLAIEEWFYLLFPFILFVMHQLFRGLSPQKIIFIALFVLIMASLYLRCNQLNINQNWDGDVRKVVFKRLDSILMGVIFAWYMIFYSNHFYRYRIIFFAVGTCLFVGASAVYFQEGLYLENSQASVFAKTFYFNIVSCCCASFLPYAWSCSKGPKQKKIAAFVTKTAILSYSMYLLHFSVVLRLMNKLLDYDKPAGTAFIYFGIYVSASYFTAYLLYSYWEKPWMNRRDNTL